jgi:hypothetical protein
MVLMWNPLKYSADIGRIVHAHHELAFDAVEAIVPSHPSQIGDVYNALRPTLFIGRVKIKRMCWNCQTVAPQPCSPDSG